MRSLLNLAESNTLRVLVDCIRLRIAVMLQLVYFFPHGNIYPFLERQGNNKELEVYAMAIKSIALVSLWKHAFELTLCCTVILVRRY